MPRVTYPPAFKAEVVATATIIGSPAAAEQFGVSEKTVRTWMGQAGHRAELEVPKASWQSLMELSLAKTIAAVASGKLHPKVTAVIAGIAARNVQEPAKGDPTRDDEEASRRARERYGLVHIVAKRMASRMAVSLTEFLDSMEATVDLPELEADCLIALQIHHRDHGCEGTGDGAVYFLEPCPEPLDLVTMWDWLESIAPVDEWLERRREAERERDRANAKQIERAKRAWTANSSLMSQTIREWGVDRADDPRRGDAIRAAVEAVEAWQAAETGLSAEDLELIARAEAELAA